MLRRLTRLAPPAALAASLLLLTPLAFAHAVLVDSTPKPGATVPAGSLRVDLKFNSRVDASHSTVQLVPAGGEAHSLELGAQTTPSEIVTHADGLNPGSYELRWQALSSDGHISRGQISFKVE